MRDFKGMKRQRGRNRNKAGSSNANSANPNRSWDSQGPENIKVRGNAQTVYERYQQLARDAASSGDRVLAENYQQHAEHYFRVLRALQPQKSFSDIAARELSNQGFDIDFEDESGAQAAAFLAAQQAAEKQVQDAERAEQGQNRDNQNREGQNRENQNRDTYRDNRDQNRERDQNRDNRDAPPRENGDEARAEGEGGSRRETRRERWERRRDERNRRFESGEGAEFSAEAESQSDSQPDAPVEEVPAAEPVERAPRRARTPRAAAVAVADDGETAALPGFLTRSSVPAEVETPAEGEAPAPRRRAPRRKVEAADSED